MLNDVEQLKHLLPYDLGLAKKDCAYHSPLLAYAQLKIFKNMRIRSKDSENRRRARWGDLNESYKEKRDDRRAERWSGTVQWGAVEKNQKRLNGNFDGSQSKKPRLFGTQNVTRSVETKAQLTQEAQKQLPNGLVTAEWNLPPKVVPKGHLVAAVQNGQDPPGNWVFVQEDSDAHEIADLWKALDLKHQMIVARVGSHGGLGATFLKASVRWPGMKPRLTPLALWNLGKQEPAMKLREAKSTDLAKFTPTEKVWVRFSAPTHYRKGLLHDGMTDSVSTVMSHVASWKKVSTSILTGGSWKWEWGKCSEQLVGHVRMSADNATKLEACSGQAGIFITRTQVLEKKEELLWIDRKKDEDREQYHARVLKFAEDRDQSVLNTGSLGEMTWGSLSWLLTPPNNLFLRLMFKEFLENGMAKMLLLFFNLNNGLMWSC